MVKHKGPRERAVLDEGELREGDQTLRVLWKKFKILS